ncbi:MAG TPA: helix-turn-helix domain-containing protein [Candidatus Acidoferrales bacterium]|nr:helix-turn-helix domain-containing protein [Candidatus Acidoferrales bacterium]
MKKKSTTITEWPGDCNWTIIEIIERKKSAWTAEKLAELLGCTPAHLYQLAKQGRMPSYRLGTMIRFDPVLTAEWLRSKQFGSKAA